jgi:excisionase family DNA binding protein
MLVSGRTLDAIEMLLRADGLGERERMGLLALLGAGQAALPDAEAGRALRAAAEQGRPVLSPEQAALRLGCTRPTLYRWLRGGVVTLRKAPIGRRRVGFYAEDVASALAARSAGQ